MTKGAKGEVALDLYAGVGFFTMPLAKTFNKVVSVDANLAATRDLYANAESAGVTMASLNEHAEEFLRKTQEKPDFVLLDPPRAGLGRGLRRRWWRWARRRLRICPATRRHWRGIWRC